MTTFRHKGHLGGFLRGRGWKFEIVRAGSLRPGAFGMTSFRRNQAHLLSYFFTVDLGGDFVLMSDYTGKEVVE